MAGSDIGQMVKIGGLRAENAQLRRERDALQQQVYDLAAKVAHLEKELDREFEHSTNVIHDQGARIIALEAQLANG